MGSLGSYEASLVAVYKRSIKVKEKNSEEDILKFLKKKPNFSKVGKEIDFEEGTFENLQNGKYFGYVYVDEYGDDYDTLENSSEDVFEYAEDWESIKPLIKMENSELEYLDLKILKDFNYYDENSDYNKEVNLGNIYESIYCSNDNSSSEAIKIPKNILEDLTSGKCKLLLKGDGSGDHC